MADLSTPNKKEPPEKFDISPDSPRVHLCNQAAYQIDAMVASLVAAARRADVESLPYLAQGIGVRIYDLNNIILSALNDEGSTESDLRIRLYGEAMDAAPREEEAHG